MPKPWDRERIAALIEKLIALIAAADLDGGEADAVADILLPKLWKASGHDYLTFRDMVAAILSADARTKLPREVLIPDWAARRH